MNNMLYYIFIIIMTLMGAFASFFFKKATGTESIKQLLFNVNLYIGGFLYVLAAFLNIYVLRFLPYSVVLPLTSITYVWTMIISYFILSEKISEKKIMGVFLIIIGAFLLAAF